MPAYAKITVEDDIGKLVASDEPAAKKVADGRKIMNEQLKRALDNQKSYAVTVDKLRETAQGALDDMVGKLKAFQASPAPDPYQLPTIKAGLSVIEHARAALKKSGDELMTANEQWRSSEWMADARKLFPNPKEFNFDGYFKMRQQTINDMQANTAKVTRVDEYHHRALGVISEAEKVGKAAAGTRERNDEARKLAADIVARVKPLSDDLDKKLAGLKSNAAALKAKLDDKLRTNLEGVLKTGQALAKNSRGSVKTLHQDRDRLQKMVDGLGMIGKPLAEQVKKPLEAYEAKVAAYEKEVETFEKGLKKK